MTQVIRTMKSLVGHNKAGEQLALRPKVKNWFDLFLVEDDDGNWPVGLELKDGMPSMAKNRPTKDKKWLYITRVDKHAELCGFQVGDIIMQIGSLYAEPHSMEDFKEFTKDYGFAIVTVYRIPK